MNAKTGLTANNVPHRLLIVGGSHDHLGGVEAFCDRSAAALRERGGWECERITAGTAYLNVRRVPTFLRSMATLLRRGFHNRPDITWIQYVNLPDLSYVLVAKLLGMKVMVTPHLGSNWRSQSDPLMRSASRLLLRLANRLSLISWTQEQEIGLPPSAPRSLIRNFLPSSVLSAELVDGADMPGALQLIHSSRLSEGKGTFLVVEVCKRLRDLGIPFHTRITGTGDAETMSRLHKMIADYGLGDQVAVLGRVPEDELLDHLRNSDILIHLSKIDSYPLIVLEAMSCSVVPVVMELAGARDMVETYCGAVVSAEHPVEETVAWLASQDLATLRAGRRRVAERVRTDYGWGRCAGALAAALDACLAGNDDVITQPDEVESLRQA